MTFQGWNTAAPQQPGMWFQVELPDPVTLTEIQFESPAPGGRAAAQAGRAAAPGRGAPAHRRRRSRFPRGYQVQVSMDGTTWSAPVAEGEGSGPTTVIPFAPVRAKFVRITQTAAVETGAPWSIQRLRLYEAPGQPGATAAR